MFTRPPPPPCECAWGSHHKDLNKCMWSGSLFQISSKCPICNKIHHGSGSMFSSVKSNNNIQSWPFVLCRFHCVTALHEKNKKPTVTCSLNLPIACYKVFRKKHVRLLPLEDVDLYGRTIPIIWILLAWNWSSLIDLEYFLQRSNPVSAISHLIMKTSTEHVFAV